MVMKYWGNSQEVEGLGEDQEHGIGRMGEDEEDLEMHGFLG